MNYATTKALRSIFLLLIPLVSTTGCMVSPNDQELLPSYQSPITPGGFLALPQVEVEIQAYRWNSGQWETISRGTSEEVAYHWEGRDWHYWHAETFQLTDHRYWKVCKGNRAKARIRAMSKGQNLQTFKEWTWEEGKTKAQVGALGPTDVTLFTNDIPYECWE